MLSAVGHLRSFDMEQVIQLFALACDKPENYERPISHWTAQELASEMVKLGIVQSISPRHVGRLLEEADLKPQSESILVNPPPDEDGELQGKGNCSGIPECFKTGTTTRTHDLYFGDDWDSGNRASCSRPALATRSGSIDLQFEYIRHGVAIA